MIASNSAKQRMDRIIRLHEEIDQIKKDIRDIYAEEKAEGGDKTAMGEAITKIRKREKDKTSFDERENMVDVYLMAYSAPSRTHTHAREGRSDAGLNIVTKHTEIQVPLSEQSEGNGSRDHQHVHSRQTDGAKHGGQDGEPAGADHAINTEMDRATEGSFETGSEAAEKGREAIPAGPEGADLSHAGAGESPATEKATVATQGEATAPTSDERVSLPVDDRSDAAANAGGDHVDGNALRVPTSVTGEGAANTALPAVGVVMEYVPPTGMKRLPFAHCFPELSKAEYERLEKDIAANRVREPIIRQGDVIVDGWNRYTIARKYRFAYPVQEIDLGRDVLLDVIEWQRTARNFTPAQEKKIAADLAKELPHRAGDIMAAFGLAEALEVA